MQKKMKLNKTDLKKVAGSFATGVTVITTRDKEGGVVGMTASSFVSVSLMTVHSYYYCQQFSSPQM